METQEFLKYLLTVNGVGVAFGTILSYLEEIVPGWHDSLTPRAKRLFMLVVCYLIPLLAAIGLGTMNREPLWAALVVGFMAGGVGFSTNQTLHTRKLKSYIPES